MAAPRLTIRVDGRRNIPRFMSGVQKKQIPFATAQAITKTLKIAEGQVVKQAKKDLDRPTPFTLRGFAVQPAKKTTLVGRLFIRPIQQRYLNKQIFGGVRTPRGSVLTMPPAKKLAKGVRLNRFGNVPKSQQAKALLAKGAFSGTINGVAGIWMPPKRTKTGKIRKGSRMQLLLAYEPQARYKPRFRFFERAQGAIDSSFEREFARSFNRAMKTAR